MLRGRNRVGRLAFSIRKMESDANGGYRGDDVDINLIVNSKIGKR